MTRDEFRAAWRALFSAEGLHRLDEKKARAEYRRERCLPDADGLPLSFYGAGSPERAPPATPPAVDVVALAAEVGAAVAAALGGMEQRVAAEVLSLITAKNGNGHAARRF